MMIKMNKQTKKKKTTMVLFNKANFGVDLIPIKYRADTATTNTDTESF